MSDSSSIWNRVSWLFAILLILIGVLNIMQVHAVPGILYILISLIYIPPFNTFIKKILGFSIPGWLKFVLGFLIMWGTLGVGDLAELYGL